MKKIKNVKLIWNYFLRLIPQKIILEVSYNPFFYEQSSKLYFIDENSKKNCLELTLKQKEVICLFIEKTEERLNSCWEKVKISPNFNTESLGIKIGLFIPGSSFEESFRIIEVDGYYVYQQKENDEIFISKDPERVLFWFEQWRSEKKDSDTSKKLIQNFKNKTQRKAA